MYHIRREDNGDERSLHANTSEGLEAAIVEAGFRTAHSRATHEIYDDVQDRVVTVVRYGDLSPTDVELSSQSSSWFLQAVIFCLVAAIVVRVLFIK